MTTRFFILTMALITLCSFTNVEAKVKSKSMNDILLVFENKVVTPKEFRKLWKKNFNEKIHFVTGVNTKYKETLDEDYLPHVNWLRDVDMRIAEPWFNKYGDLKVCNGALVVEKKEDVMGHFEHPLYSKPWLDSFNQQDISVQDTTVNFILTGTVTKGLRDVAYIINFEDEKGHISEIPTAVVLVKEGKFYFRTKIQKPTTAHIRAVFEDGSICEAWIKETFVPNSALRILVMDNTYRRFENSLIR